MRALWQLLGRMCFAITSLLLSVWPKPMPARTRILVQTRSGVVLVVKPWLSDGKWSLPGGGLRKNEQPIEAALRELHEETGLTVPQKDCQALGLQAFPYKGVDYRYHCFTITVAATSSLQHPPLEIIDAQWLPLTELTPHSAHPHVSTLTRAVVQ